jgi:hypothetical protein
MACGSTPGEAAIKLKPRRKRPAGSRTHGADPEMDIWEIGMMMAMTFMTPLPRTEALSRSGAGLTRAREGSLDVVRLGLTRKQAVAHDLLDADGKAELDGLPVPVLDSIVREFIESHLDPDIQRRIVQAEPKMRSQAARLVRKQSEASGDKGEINPPGTGPDWSWAR